MCVRVACVLCKTDVCQSWMRVCEARVSRIESRVESPETLVESPETLVSRVSCETRKSRMRLESRDSSHRRETRVPRLESHPRLTHLLYARDSGLGTLVSQDERLESRDTCVRGSILSHRVSSRESRDSNRESRDSNRESRDSRLSSLLRDAREIRVPRFESLA